MLRCARLARTLLLALQSSHEVGRLCRVSWGVGSLRLTRSVVGSQEVGWDTGVTHGVDWSARVLQVLKDLMRSVFSKYCRSLTKLDGVRRALLDK